MISPETSKKSISDLTDPIRALYGFLFGVLVMGAFIHVFQINTFDFENMQRGVRLLFQGANPWEEGQVIPHFYNPPHSIFFLWPMLFLSAPFFVWLGGTLLFGLVFYQKCWVSLAWFLTNSALYLFATGGIDMFVIGGGLLLLLAGDQLFAKPTGIVLRVLAYGLLLIKPQGTVFIVFLYLILRRDWIAGLLALLLYGLPFLRLYPDWLRVILSQPPLSQTIAAHTLYRKFGPILASIIAVLVIVSRRWRFWQLGGALAGILSPYGMPGIPIFLTLGAIGRISAIPAVVIFSACLSLLTWVTPPSPETDFYSFVNPLMSIYHLSMLGIALILACLLPEKSTEIEWRGVFPGVHLTWPGVKNLVKWLVSIQ